MTNPNEYDPLAESDKAPAISWKDLPVGTIQTLDVSKPCGAPIHYRDYESQEYMYWQTKGRPSAVPTDRPVQQIVYEGVDKNGEPAALFIKIKGEQLFFKLQAAQKAYGKRVGGTDTVDRIHIKLTGRENPDGKKQNQFEVKITAAGPKPTEPTPDPMSDGADPWGNGGDEQAPF